MELTKMTASTFIITTSMGIGATYHLLTEMKFSYVLQAIFPDEILKKFFCQSWLKIWGNFHIDIVDITAAAKTDNLHNLLKDDLLLVGNNESGFSSCMDSVKDDYLEILHEHTVQDTQSLLDCDENTFKHKIVYIAGHLVHKYGKLLQNVEDNEDISTKYLTELKQGGLHVPTFINSIFC